MEFAGEDFPATEPQIPDEVRKAFEDFGGAAAVLRFDDGALELEVAGDAAVIEENSSATDRGDDALATLPEDTAAAIGIGFEDGWAQTMIDRFAGMMSDGAPVESMVEEAERATGLSLPEDLETLVGDSTAIAMGSDFDPKEFFMSQDGAGVPVGAKVKGDPEAIEAVLEKIRAKLGRTGEGKLLQSASDGDMVAIGPNADYLDRIVGDGGLGDTDGFRNVVREAEQAGAIVFVNFDAGDWLAGLAEGDQEAVENLTPLEGFGISVWQDGDTGHGVMRLTTN